MIYYNTNQFKLGLKVIFKNEPYEIINNEFVKPGKGQAFVRIKLRNFFSNKIIEKTLKSTEKLKKANVKELCLTYLYNDGNYWYFMNFSQDYEQFIADKKVIKDVSKWLTEQTKYNAIIWKKKLISIIPPKFVNLKVVNTISSTEQKNYLSNKKKEKIAYLSTGIYLKVPFFIKNGDIIKVDTQLNKYILRLK